jgi:hypothetical protein
VSAFARITRLTVDGQHLDLLVDAHLDADTTAALVRAARLAQATRARDLDRIVAAELARDPEATLDRLCRVARRRRSDVAQSRKRVRAASQGNFEGSSPASAVPWPGNGISARSR